MNSSKYYNYKLCAACGGDCCQRMAGQYVPEDFKQEITAEFILSILQTGKFAIDWWEGDDQPHYIRPRHVGEPAVKGSWGGVCVNWSKESGCSLSEEDRPTGCKKLVPKVVGTGELKEYRCNYKKSDKLGKYEMAVRWKPYQKEIFDAIDQYRQYENIGSYVEETHIEL